jgi:tetraacyldisaccharide 4'-kinase
MTHTSFAKILLAPFSLLYGIGIFIRNLLYDAEVVKSSKFSIPTISVGNLSIGGAGKTPHIEYLIELLNPYINLATLSRGYNRSSKGFRIVHPSNTALLVGDEPLMYARKHRGIVVAIGESRSVAIPQIVGYAPEVQTILLDDAFQHRSIKPYLNILLTQFEKPFTRDFLLPSGRLREWKSSYERADVIIVSKCPDDLTEKQQKSLIDEINPQSNQKVFFTRYSYKNPYSFYYPNMTLPLTSDLDVIMISGIANTNYLIQYLNKKVGTYANMEYADHHNFSEKDINYISKVYEQRDSQRKLILTTEKDAMRLDKYRKKLFDLKIPVYILPLNLEFLFDQKKEFDQLIKDKLLQFEV